MGIEQGVCDTWFVSKIPDVSTRMTTFGIIYSFNAIIFGGTMPLMCTWLYNFSIYLPGVYYISICLLSLTMTLWTNQSIGVSWDKRHISTWRLFYKMGVISEEPPLTEDFDAGLTNATLENKQEQEEKESVEASKVSDEFFETKAAPVLDKIEAHR